MQLSWCSSGSFGIDLLSFTQKFSWLQMASAKKVLTPTLSTENTMDDSFEYIPPKVSLLATELQLSLYNDVLNVFCLLYWWKPKGKRFTTAKAPQNTTINMEEIMSPSEEESEEEEDEWRPEKPEKGRRVSKKAKATGVSRCALCGPTQGRHMRTSCIISSPSPLLSSLVCVQRSLQQQAVQMPQREDVVRRELPVWPREVSKYGQPSARWGN